MAKKHEWTFYQQSSKMVHKHIKRCSPSLPIREMQISTAEGYITVHL